MAEAGPGPSSMMASSPSMLGTAKPNRVKRRVVNLVNPADPVDFSEGSLTCESSMEKENIPVQVMRRERETTPSPIASVQPYTPLGGKDGVRGILRQTGTPGSGNGVRFFPKNKFRIITPNQSLNPPPRNDDEPIPSQPTPQQPPPSPRSGSFLSQLLAVTIPSMSPRRPTAAPPQPIEPEKSEDTEQSIDPEESWEVPGQEGEVSLIASSIASERSLAESEPEEVPWTGVPEVHSSPLSLPVGLPDTSMDKSGESELPSRDIQLPADMSDLLTQRLDRPSDVDSFSISDFSRTNFKPYQRQLSVGTPITEESSVGDSLSSHGMGRADETGMTSFLSLADRTDDNPTIRRQLSPLPARAMTPSQPLTPPTTKAFSSIFADMSAEQAGLSWPLSAQVSPMRSETGVDETAFHSVLVDDTTALTPPDVSIQKQLPASGIDKTPGDVTQYFDCNSPSPMPVVSAFPVSADMRTSSSRLSTGANLIHPAKALFEAHSAHTTALGSELELYRGLATKLQTEVTERDGLLARLNLRVIEGEVWRVRVDELEKQVKELKSSQSTHVTRSQSLSPTPMRRGPSADHIGDRTTVDQATSRDAEIRLAKSLADQAALSKQMAEMQTRFDEQTARLNDALSSVESLERRERDTSVQARRTEEELRAQLEVVVENERSLKAKLDEAQMQLTNLDDLKQRNQGLEERVVEQETEMRQLQDMRKDDAREINELAAQMEELSARVSDEEELINKLAEAETRAGEEMHIRKQVEKEMRSLRKEQKERDEEIHHLKESLEQTKADLLIRLNAPSAAPEGEVARLRAESASKDLEIITLQRRKNELKEDLEMLNIALDSKQQELELIKRKFSVRGIAGSTPLAPTRNLNTPASGMELETPMPGRKSINTRRRSSAAFITPSLGSVREHGKVLKGGHGTDLWKSATSTRVLSKMEEENQPPVGERESVRGSIRRERLLA